MGITKSKIGVGHFVRAALLGGSMAVALAGPSAAADKFPRLGMISTGGPQKYGSDFQAYASKFNVVVIGGAWEGWQRGAGYSKETVISSIKAKSHVGTHVFQYVALNSLLSASAAANGFPTWYNQVNARHWWLYPVGTSGTPVHDPQSTARWLVNMGPNVPIDPSTGLGPYAWGAKYLEDLFHLGRYSGTSASPSMDGLFLDNVLIDPSNGGGNVGNGDWERNYTTQAHNAASTYNTLIAGQKEFYTYLATNWPGSQQLGNVGGSFGIAMSNYYSATDSALNSQIVSGTSALSGVIAGGAMEHAIGKSFSIEYYGGSVALQQWMRTALANSSGSKLMMLGHGSMQANGSDPLAFSSGVPTSWSAAYQGMRYGLCATLMNNGYYQLDNGVYDQETVSNRLFFDEFDNAGRSPGYLGNPVANSYGNVQTTSWSNGVWMREFQGGVVLWNPKGSGTRTVNVSGLVSPSGHTGLKHILGSQNPSLNNGYAVTSVTLRDRDGLILLWNTP